MNNLILNKLDSLTVIANAKINLHLEILGLRPDGFHELAMIMQSIDLCDYLELSVNNEASLSLTCDNPNLSTDKDNLIIKAAEILRQNSNRNDLGANIRLKKRIPIGAGLAGGSSNGAATLIGLNTLWKLNFKTEKLHEFASILGSDMPFCLNGGTQLCFGRGDLLEKNKFNIETMALILVKDPKVSVSTPLAYKMYRDKNKINYLTTENQFEIRRKVLRDEFSISSFSSKYIRPLRNDLQQIVSASNPSVRKALKILSGFPSPLAVAMSGSGPSCFAVYSDIKSAKSDLAQSGFLLKEVGLESWICSFSTSGVTLQNE